MNSPKYKRLSNYALSFASWDDLKYHFYDIYFYYRHANMMKSTKETSFQDLIRSLNGLVTIKPKLDA